MSLYLTDETFNRDNLKGLTVSYHRQELTLSISSNARKGNFNCIFYYPTVDYGWLVDFCKAHKLELSESQFQISESEMTHYIIEW